MYREVSFYVKPDLHFEAYRKLGFLDWMAAVPKKPDAMGRIEI